MDRLLIVAALCAACGTTPARENGWNGEVRRWGTLREVLRGGAREARVDLDDAVRPGSVGLGALGGLTGEVAVLDGELWVAQVAGGELLVTRGPAPGRGAALLALAEVQRWSEDELEGELDLDELEERLAALAPRFRRGAGDPAVFPFVLEGEALALDAHVLNGACPETGDVTPATEPVRASLAGRRVTLVGFYSELGPGVLTHHGSRVHAHVIDARAPWTGHVDEARVATGAVLRLPVGRSGASVADYASRSSGL